MLSTLNRTSQARRDSILEAAHKVFTQYGYRKTSVEDVARAAEVSRQCVYGYFPTKTSLFMAAVIHRLDASFEKIGWLRDETGLSLHEKIVRIFDELGGKQSAQTVGGRWELLGAFFTHIDEKTFTAYLTRLDRTVGGLIAEAAARGSIRLKRTTPEEVAEVLREVSGGISSHSESREDFRNRMERAVRVILPMETPA